MKEKLSSFQEKTNEYKRLLRSDKELTVLRKTISSLLRQLSEENLLGQESITTTSVESLGDLIKNVKNTINTFNYPVRFGIEAWKWNPVEPESYEVIAFALRHMEDTVALLRENVSNVDATEHLIVRVLYDMI